MIKKNLLLLIMCSLFAFPMKAKEGDIIQIVYTNGSATVTIPSTAAVVSSVSGAHVTLTSSTTTEEYTYQVKGSTTNGSLTINGSYKLTLRLAGVSIVSQQGAAIDIECGKRIAVIVEDGTINSLTDAGGGSHKAALYFTGHPEFEGGGVLNVTGNTKHAICAKEYVQLKKTVGTINVLAAASDGIHCGKGKVNNEHRYFQMNGGVLNIKGVQSDGIDSDDYGIISMKGGVLNVNVTADDATGLKCDSIFYMSGGEVNLCVSGTGSEGIRAGYDAQLTGGIIRADVGGDGSKGIKGKRQTAGTVLDGGSLTFAGTRCDIHVHAGDVLASDGSTVLTKARAVSADGRLTHRAGEVEIYAYGQMDTPWHSDIEEVAEGGVLTIHRAPWRFYYGDYRYDITTYVSLVLDGHPVADTGDYAIGAFVDDECVGVAENDYLRIYNNGFPTEALVFRAYDYVTNREYALTPSQVVYFPFFEVVGTPDAPLTLSGKTTLIGDVNNDGAVDISDVTTLVNIILGKATDTYGNADVNGDGGIDISDVTTLVNLILGKG